MTPSGPDDAPELDLPEPDRPANTWENSPGDRRRDNSASQHSDAEPDGGIEAMLERIGLVRLAAIAVGVAAIGIGAIVLLSMGDGSPEFDFNSGTDGQQHSADPVDDSLYSTDGIIAAIRADGWAIDRSRDPVELADHSHRTLRIRSRDHLLGLRIYTAETHQAVERIEAGISTPDRHVTLGHIIVRIMPDSPAERRLADDLQQHLRDFRDTVAEEAGR